jgi:Cdc6-like AAA superfamily ATPase
MCPLQAEPGITEKISTYYEKTWQNIATYHPKIMIAIFGISYAASKIPWKSLTWSFFEPFYNNMNITYEKNAIGLQDRLNAITPVQPETVNFLSLDYPQTIEKIKDYCQAQSLWSRTKNGLATVLPTWIITRCSENTPVKNIILYGEAGAGKRTLINTLAREKGVNVYSINLHIKYNRKELGQELLSLYEHFHKLGRRVIFTFSDYDTPNNFDGSLNIIQLLQFLHETSERFTAISTVIVTNRKDDLVTKYKNQSLLNGLLFEEYTGVSQDKKKEALNKKLAYCGLKRSSSLQTLLETESKNYQETSEIIDFCQPNAVKNNNIIGTVVFKQAHSLQYPKANNESE